MRVRAVKTPLIRGGERIVLVVKGVEAEAHPVEPVQEVVPEEVL